MSSVSSFYHFHYCLNSECKKKRIYAEMNTMGIAIMRNNKIIVTVF